MRSLRILALAIAVAFSYSQVAGAEALPADQQKKLDAKIEALKKWGSDPALVAAVKKHNSDPGAEAKAMDKDKWKKVTVLDPLVKALTKSAAAEFLQKNKDESMSEAFVSGADGTKVGFLAKTSGWTHKGNPKHDDPMAGKTWQGKVEVDESSGVKQIQVAVPVVDGGKPIGSIVVGVQLSKL